MGKYGPPKPGDVGSNPTGRAKTKAVGETTDNSNAYLTKYELATHQGITQLHSD